MCFIEELYYGDINPNEKNCIKSEQYTNAMRVFCDNEKRLTQILEGRELTLFNELVNASDEMSAISNLENFKSGFRLGIQMILDSLISE